MKRSEVKCFFSEVCDVSNSHPETEVEAGSLEIIKGDRDIVDDHMGEGLPWVDDDIIE